MPVFRVDLRFIKMTGEIERGSMMRDRLNDLHDELSSAEDAMAIAWLDAEEPVIAPTAHLNRSETLFGPQELAGEELEAVVAPGMKMNHDETFLAAAELEAEELEPIIAPGHSVNHNEKFLTTETGRPILAS
jgi:hypothetical protein